MTDIQLDQFMAANLAKIDYQLRELRQAYVLSGRIDPNVLRRLEHATEAVGDARDAAVH